MAAQHNVRTVLGEPDNPRLPAGTVNAALIVNTYHEIEDPGVILDQVSHALVSGGRLVIADPMQTERGVLSSDVVEAELRRHGFTVLSGDEKLHQSTRQRPVVADHRQQNLV